MEELCLGCMERYDSDLDICPHCGYCKEDQLDETLHLEPGVTLRDGTYLIGKVLGFGGFGVTYVAWNTVLEQRVAIKEYLPSEFSTRMPGHTEVTVFNGDKAEQYHDGVTKFVDEARRLAQFQNTSGIVRIFDSFEENNTAYIVMEYLQGVTLTEYLGTTGPLAGDEAIRLLMPVMQSLAVVHEGHHSPRHRARQHHCH
jgi:serine/threonine protein kinase